CCFGRRPRVRYAAPFSYTTLFRSAFDPDEPVFLLPEVTANLAALRRPDTLMADRRARSYIGQAVSGTETELARRKVQVVGTFSLGPNFFADGTVIMSRRNFAQLFAG